MGKNLVPPPHFAFSWGEEKKHDSNSKTPGQSTNITSNMSWRRKNLPHETCEKLSQFQQRLDPIEEFPGKNSRSGRP
eukprot:TRINITY_DN1779_c0_g1_i2.p1 TRINITY_DN1779_c0_g1~~TRINITY_DN1779_c0_g1_i2.p1  ORF type:complete len:77 (-),score=13.26 TRINITY_DN1779_c0_g1_i2:221-451(-)